jgi:hypothetical protein
LPSTVKLKIKIGTLGNQNIEISTKLTFNFIGISISSKAKKDFRGKPSPGPLEK